MSKYEVTIKLVIDSDDYGIEEDELGEVVYDELLDLMRSDLMSACEVKDIED